MWRQVRNVLKKNQGAAIVEVSFIIPLLLFLLSGMLLFSLYLLDVGAVKKDTIVIAQQEEKKIDLEENVSFLTVAKRSKYQKKDKLEKVVVEVEMSGRLPWDGLLDYMHIKYKSTIKTVCVKDRRKEWMWGAEILPKKDE